MTEEEWLASEDPAAMLEALRKQNDRVGQGYDISDRKLRMFACACLRAEPHFPRLRNAMIAQSLRLAEGHADGTIDAARLATGVFRHNDSATWLYQAQAAACCWSCAAEGAVEVVSLATGSHEEEEAEESSRRCADLLRDIFGNPFRPVGLSAGWLTGDVLALAHAAYDERSLPSGHLDTARLTILSDALEDAGCADSIVLSHLRSAGPHVRGCWAIDLLTGRE